MLIAILAGLIGTLTPVVRIMATESKTNCWAVIVGVSEYWDGENVLYSSHDAIRLKNILAPVWGEENVLLLVNRQATKANILSAIDWMAGRASPEDTVLFYFSGHGTEDGYLAPHDARFIDTFISRHELSNRLNAIPSEHRAVILDTCHAGQFASVLDENDSISLFSSRADELSWSYGSLRSGVFSYFVLEALNNFSATDANDDYALSVEELFIYAVDRTISMSSEHMVQNPVMVDRYEGELVLLELLLLEISPGVSAEPGLIIIDGIPYDSVPPRQLIAPGTSYEISLIGSYYRGEGTRYVFAAWDDGITTPTRIITKGKYTAEYDTEFLLTVESLYGNPGRGGWYKRGTIVTLSVPEMFEEPGIRRIFDGWTGNHSSNDPETLVTMSRPVNTTATWRNEFLLTLYSIYGSPAGGGWYREGDTASISVESLIETPDTRRHFDGWTGDIETGSPEATVTLDRPLEAEASWWHEYKVSVTSEYGEVSGQGWYREGETVTVSTVAVVGFLVRQIFDGWDGDISNPESITSFTLDGPKTINATWRTDYSQLFMLTGGMALIAVSVGVLLVRRKRVNTGLNSVFSGSQDHGQGDQPGQ